ncbi:MAG: hypothetical protein IKA98_03540 [Candidatus Methanomethylophilaceae archaeon]|nr:hypothetical protein [Candidatus Methanomethylophilaceae archaeon]
MPVRKAEYLGRFLDDVDRVMSGRHGSITGDRWLVNNYSADFLPLIDKYLSCEDEVVRAETILLLCDVRERAVMGRVRDMRKSDVERVRLACLGYLNIMQDEDDLIPDLFAILEHKTGEEFSRAATRMASVARKEDVPRLRRIYGQVRDDMRSEVGVILDRVVSRNPDLRSKRDLIMSVPVYPDEDAFDRFLDTSIEYLDVRYRNNVLPVERISRGTFNNVAHALNKMRTRLYNEADNLVYYGVDKDDRFKELTDLIRWASADLSRKEVVGGDRSSSHKCPRCGGLMISNKGIWTCPDCGGL